MHADNFTDLVRMAETPGIPSRSGARPEPIAQYRPAALYQGIVALSGRRLYSTGRRERYSVFIPPAIRFEDAMLAGGADPPLRSPKCGLFLPRQKDSVLFSAVTDSCLR